MKRILAVLFLFWILGGCNSNVTDDIEDAIDIADGVPRKDIDTSKLAVNAFANDSRFGSASAQYAEIAGQLKLSHVRVLFAWTNDVQPSPSSAPNFSFYDHILASLPANLDALVVLTGVPNWMNDSGNWSGGDPRETFVRRWVAPIAARYGKHPRISGFQLWNEPNRSADPQNALMGFGDASNYVDLLARGSNVIQEAAPGKLVLNAATSAINQNFPSSLDYNRAMRDAGAQNFVDRWAIHYYGSQYENVVRSNGVEDFLNGLDKPVWVTESGEQGTTEQLEYGERTWPFLIDHIPSIERIYIWQFADGSDPTTTYGLRNPSTQFPVSDLYVFLRDR